MDPYSILGLQPGASEEDAKAAFRKLAKTCHPDLHPNDPDAEKRFKQINEAYDKIKNPEPEQVRFNAGGFHNFHFDDMFGSGGGVKFEDLFGELRARQRNSDMHLQCTLTLEETFHGKELNIQIPGRGGSRTINATLPPGIRHGMRIGVPKSGNQTNMTLPPGDLFITVNVMPHNRFMRDMGNNLITTAPVSVFEVLLGKSIEVINIEGTTLTVNIPVNFDSSRKLRLAGQGMPDPHTKVRGDLFVELFVTYPELNAEQRVLIEQATTLTSV